VLVLMDVWAPKL